jgi:pimeloyl-ACP methyl ester carboxylesterase
MRGGRAITSIGLSCTLVAVLVTSGAQASDASVHSRVAGIQWLPCHADTGFPFECARVRVPLDYSNLQAGTISLALVRLPASDPAQRIGSLFVNPGGPGGSGVDAVLQGGPHLYGGAIQSRFDIVGFDPRGIARSTALRCFDNTDQWAPFFTRVGFPLTPKQERRRKQADLFLAGACAAQGDAIMDHMATADVARDLDRLRAAVGDDRLTYMGISYGSFLGVTYANMFPNRVRAVIVDGVLDPIAWTTGVDAERHTVPFSTRLRSDMGAQATLDEFFRLCDAGGPNCAFGPHSADRFERLADRLRRSALTIVDPDGSETRFFYQDLILNTLFALYNSFVWPDLAQFLAYLEAQVSPQRLGASLDSLHQAEGFGVGASDTSYRNFLEGFPGVACSDSESPTSYEAWSDQGAISDQRFGYFGRPWTWISSICAQWPGFDRQRYMGPFDRKTANSLLVIGNLFDPATRYQGAQIVHRLMPRSALLTVHGWGHTSLFVSRCVDRISVKYLIRRTTPDPGTICRQDAVPFKPDSATSAASSATRAQLIGNLVPWPLLRSVGTS